MSKQSKLAKISVSNNPKLWLVIGITVAGVVILAETRRRRLRTRYLIKEDFGAFIQRFELLPFPQPPPPAARLTLAGLTFTVKDVFDINDYVTGFGNPDWKETHEVAGKTALVVTSLLKNGAACVGKTVMDELGFGITGENVHYGTPTNPRMPSRVPGGSSSGSAVAVASELADFALGWFARDPSILHRVGHVLLQLKLVELRRTRRFVVADDLFQLSKVSQQKTAPYTKYEFKTNHEEWVKSVRPRLGPDVSDRVLAAITTPHENIKSLYKVRTEMRAALQNLLKDDGILVVPTVADHPLKLNSKKGLSAEFHDRAFALSSIARKHEDCPISVSFVACHGGDKFLLDTVLDMYSSLQEQVSIVSNSPPSADTNGNMDASELLKEKAVKAYLRRGTARESLMFYKEALQDFMHALVLEPQNKVANLAEKRLRKLIR
ncbi:hypothetical protein RJ639_041083 [Escallonia herrerae]|uniref:Amidase domain-containing protein n=1 Tax=Escallonia herrerae TaxID=1293975 RepID=A0AA88WGZ6_9ASTE|nr:hypothetical protein RJ639_041083 [Escallonia herrerae]